MKGGIVDRVTSYIGGNLSQLVEVRLELALAWYVVASAWTLLKLFALLEG